MEHNGKTRKLRISESDLRSLLSDPYLTVHVIAERLRVNDCTIRDWRKRFGIERPRKTYTVPLVKMTVSEDQLRDMVVNQRMSDVAISKQLEVANVTVLKWRQRFGIKQPIHVKKGRTIKSSRRKFFLSADELRKLYIEDQLSQRQIAEIHSVNQMTISNWLFAYGIKSRPKGGRQSIALPEEELRRLYHDEQCTMESLGEKFGCGESTVRKNLIEHGLTIDSKEVARRRLEKNKSSYPHRSEHKGYIQLRMPQHPDCDPNGSVPEHRFVAETAIGRRLLPGEHVHHINLRKCDNRPDNLAVLPSKESHARLHRYMEYVAVYLCRLTDVRPEPLEFDAQVFWAGKYITRIDLIQEAQQASGVNQDLLNSTAIVEKAVVVN